MHCRAGLFIEMDDWRFFARHRQERGGESVLIFVGKFAYFGNGLFQQLCHRRHYTTPTLFLDRSQATIGAAFSHQSGDGFNVILQALPLPGSDGTCKIVLRPPKEDKNDQHDRNDKEAQDERARQAVRQSNDRRHGRTR